MTTPSIADLRADLSRLGVILPAGWDLRWARLPDGIAGFTDFVARTVTISPDYPAAYQRVALCHEFIHVKRGPISADPVRGARQEFAVENETARRLISIRSLVQALGESDRQQGADMELLNACPSAGRVGESGRGG